MLPLVLSSETEKQSLEQEEQSDHCGDKTNMVVCYVWSCVYWYCNHLLCLSIV